jgi:hypothetical protein
MKRFFEWLLALDRRWIYLLVLVSLIIPIVIPIGLPVTTTSSTRMAFEYIESLAPGDVVWLSFDYGPSSAPENDPMAEAFLRQCFIKRLKVIVTALYPLGALGISNNILAKVSSEYSDLKVDEDYVSSKSAELKYGEDYVNMGYKDGAAAVIRSLGDGISKSFPADVNGRPYDKIPMLRGVRDIYQVKLVFSVATGIIGEYWITQGNAQFGTPTIVGPTAVGAPKYYAYLNAGQMKGMLSGMKGAAEYEKLLCDKYPQLDKYYVESRLFTATKGMDGQTVVHIVILVLIVLGNIAHLRLRRGRKEAA